VKQQGLTQEINAEISRSLVHERAASVRFEHYALRKERNTYKKFVGNFESDVFLRTALVTYRRWLFKKDQQVDNG
jgi:hypothetical protein